MTSIDRPLEGRVAYITGAARGQGRAHCVRLARAGATIVAIDACSPVGAHIGYPPATPEDLAETVRLVEGEGAKIYADRVDVRDLAGQQRVTASAIEQFGRLDVVVANAGVMSWGRAWEIPAEQWQEMIDINLTGFWNTIAATVPAMIEAGNGGSIINAGSPTGLTMSGAGWSAYSSSKASVMGLTRIMAADLAQYGIRCNSIVPGSITTPLTKVLHDDPVVRPQLEAMHPIGRLGLPEDMAGIAVFLASDESKFATGSLFFVDGGISVR
jgi:SDR family mycofactocin-dependent oxidoreductase